MLVEAAVREPGFTHKIRKARAADTLQTELARCGFDHPLPRFSGLQSRLSHCLAFSKQNSRFSVSRSVPRLLRLYIPSNRRGIVIASMVLFWALDYLVSVLNGFS